MADQLNEKITVNKQQHLPQLQDIHTFFINYILYLVIFLITFFFVTLFFVFFQENNPTLVVHISFILSNLIFGIFLSVFYKKYIFKIYIYYGIIMSFFHTVVLSNILYFLLRETEFMQLALKSYPSLWYEELFLAIYPIFFIPIGAIILTNHIKPESK